MKSKRIITLVMTMMIVVIVGIAQNKTTRKMKTNDNKTALEVYNEVKPQGSLSNPVRVNISGYAVKVGPDVYGLPSVEISESKGGKARVLCVLPFTDYFKLRHVSKGDKVVMNGEVRGHSQKYDIVVVKESQIKTVNDKKP